MYSTFNHWAHWSYMLTALSMFSPCTQWVFGPLYPVTIALETCLKSYLLRSWIWPGQVIDTMHGIGRGHLTDNMTISAIMHAFRIASERNGRVDVGHSGFSKESC